MRKVILLPLSEPPLGAFRFVFENKLRKWINLLMKFVLSGKYEEPTLGTSVKHYAEIQAQLLFLKSKVI
jgi:hypothetical protein